jgi:hypothetical protein
MALSNAGKKVTWLKMLLEELGFKLRVGTQRMGGSKL